MTRGARKRRRSVDWVKQDQRRADCTDCDGAVFFEAEMEGARLTVGDQWSGICYAASVSGGAR
jgi:hypothetical protein